MWLTCLGIFIQKAWWNAPNSSLLTGRSKILKNHPCHKGTSSPMPRLTPARSCSPKTRLSDWCHQTWLAWRSPVTSHGGSNGKKTWKSSKKTFDDAKFTCYFTDPRSINLCFRSLFFASPNSVKAEPESITNGEMPSRASRRIHAKLKLRPLHMSLGRHGDFAKKDCSKAGENAANMVNKFDKISKKIKKNGW